MRIAEKNWGRLLVILVLVLFFSFGPLVQDNPAYADTLTQDQLAEDLTQAKFLTYLYSLYTDDLELNDVKDMEELVTILNKYDKWARYYDPANFETFNLSNEGKMVGIGIKYEVREDGQVEVMEKVPNSPAARSDMQVGDIIVKIDDIELKGLTKEEIQRQFQGEENTVVTVEVERKGTSHRYILIRSAFEVVSVYSELLVDSGMGYIQISQFSTNTANQFYQAVNSLSAQGVKGLVIDLRQNPGGTLDSAIDISGAFIGEGPAIFIKSPSGIQFGATGNWPDISLPMVVLVNENTASAAELVSANIQDAGRAVIIGTQTYGKGVMQTVFQLPSGAGIVFTTNKFFSIDNWSVQDNLGVTPDIYVEGAQEQLNKAIEVLKTQKGRGNKLSFVINSHNVWVEGKQYPLTNAPYTKDGSTYLPLAETAEAAGLKISNSGVSLMISSDKLKVMLDTQTSKFLAKGVLNPLKTETKNGVLYVPASFFRDAFGAALEWNSATSTMKMTFPE